MRLDPEHLARQLDGSIAPLYVVLGDELLLVMEAVDGIRAYVRGQGYTERTILTADQRFDWMNLFQWGGNPRYSVKDACSICEFLPGSRAEKAV